MTILHVIKSYIAVNQCPFNSSESVVQAVYAIKANRRIRGEIIELDFGGEIYRFDFHGLRECTLTYNGSVDLDGICITGSFRTWLKNNDLAHIDHVGFRNSIKFGILVDLDDEKYEYISVLRKDVWNSLDKSQRLTKH